jgi:hypothetical protein
MPHDKTIVIARGKSEASKMRESSPNEDAMKGQQRKMGSDDEDMREK